MIPYSIFMGERSKEKKLAPSDKIYAQRDTQYEAALGVSPWRTTPGQLEEGVSLSKVEEKESQLLLLAPSVVLRTLSRDTARESLL